MPDFDPAGALLRSRFKFQSTQFPGRWCYVLRSGKYLSVDLATGKLRPGGTTGDGGSEAFILDDARGLASLDPGAESDFAPTYSVNTKL